MTDKERYVSERLRLRRGPDQRDRLVARLRELLGQQVTYARLQAHLERRYGVRASRVWLWRLIGTQQPRTRTVTSEASTATEGEQPSEEAA